MPDHLLIVDDDRDIAEALAELLAEEGYGVSLAPDGARALAWLEDHDPPAAILLDLMMPVMDGFAFRAAQLQRDELGEIPTIVLTAGRIDDRVRALDVHAILRKPVDLEDLLAGLKQSRGASPPGITPLRRRSTAAGPRGRG